MNNAFRSLIIILSVAVVSSPVAFADAKRLTPERVAELTAAAGDASGKSISVEISSFGKVELGKAPGHVGLIENIREFRFPTEFEPPKGLVDPKHPGVVVPTTPTDFETINAGWTIHFHAKVVGGVVSLTGVADFVDVKLVNGGYGALAGPIYSNKGDVLTSNVLQQPLQQTTTSRFHLWAIPGKAYEILLYKGGKAERHTVTVSMK